MALSVFDTQGNQVPAIFQTGMIDIVGLALSGRVFSPYGLAHRNALVTVIDSKGVRLSVRSSSFGIYRFDNLVPGEQYTLTVDSKRYRFQPQFLTLTNASVTLDLHGLE